MSSSEPDLRTLAQMSSRLLGQPMWKHLANDPITRFRQDYQKFRRGEAKGARRDDLILAFAEKRPMSKSQPGPAVFELTDDHTMGEHEAMMEEVQHLVNEFRLGYRRFRQGRANGARMDMDRLLEKLSAPDAPHIHLLPTSRLTEAKRQDREYRLNRSKSFLDRPQFHVHFGAGRLGLGLVVPAICQGKIPFALVNPPFPEFDGIIKRHAGKDAVLVVNGEVLSSPLRVVLEASHLPAGTSNLLVISNNQELLTPLLRRATTFSTSVGPGMPATAQTLLGALPKEERPSRALFACENDHAGVERLSQTLQDRVLVSSCMVDRICVSRDLLDETLPAELRTCTEPYTGCLMVRPLPPGSPEDPFAGSAVLKPNTLAQADYLERRKLVTVNGMHTTLAFLSLAHHCRNTDRAIELQDDKLASPLNELPLQTMATLDEKVQREVLAWCAARQLFLIFEFGEDFVMLAHGVPEELSAEEREVLLCNVMWDYASTCVQRFSSASDTCGRILGGGAMNRWRTRLKPIDSFLREHDSLGRMALRLVSKAGVDVGFMRRCIARLCDDSEDLMHGQVPKRVISRVELAH